MGNSRGSRTAKVPRGTCQVARSLREAAQTTAYLEGGVWEAAALWQGGSLSPPVFTGFPPQPGVGKAWTLVKEGTLGPKAWEAWGPASPGSYPRTSLGRKCPNTDSLPTSSAGVAAPRPGRQDPASAANAGSSLSHLCSQHPLGRHLLTTCRLPQPQRPPVLLCLRGLDRALAELPSHSLARIPGLDSGHS